MRKQMALVLALGCIGSGAVLAGRSAAAPAANASSAPRLTIYNEQFAVVRETVPLDLKSGVNDVRFNGITMHLEPISVVLRDPTGKRALQVLEQNYRGDPVTQELLLSRDEGQAIDFVRTNADGTQSVVRGKIIRSSYMPPRSPYQTGFGQSYYQSQQYVSAYGVGQPIIEVDGKLQFTLPGIPQFPALADDSILKPELDWTLQTDKAGPLDAELAYVTSGMTWSADYNIVAPEQGDTVTIIGWVTLDNQTGKTFENAHIKLMAGDVNKIQPQIGGYFQNRGAGAALASGGGRL